METSTKKWGTRPGTDMTRLYDWADVMPVVIVCFGVYFAIRDPMEAVRTVAGVAGVLFMVAMTTLILAPGVVFIVIEKLLGRLGRQRDGKRMTRRARTGLTK